MSLNFGKMDFAVSFSPMTAFPLDARSYFESLAAAEAAAAQAVEAGSAEGTVYFGQTVTVVENGVAQMFQVQPDGTLGEIGGKIEIDEKQFVIDEETGKLNLYGFANAVAGAQLVVEEVEVEGKKVKQLKWVKPDTTTVDGLATAVANLQAADTAFDTRLGKVEEKLGKEAEGETAATGLFADIAELEGRVGSAEDEIDLLEEGLGDLEELVGVPAGEGVEASGVFAQIDGLDARIDDLEAKDLSIDAALSGKANASDVYQKTEVYTKKETDDAIAVAVADAEHLKRKTFNTIAEAETFISENILTAEQYIYMIPVEGGVNGDKYDEYMYISNTLERVGDWEVDLSDYAKADTVNNLAGQVNGIAAQLPDFAKSADVEEALAGKVDNATLEGYATTGALADEVAKLATKDELALTNAALNGKVEIETGKSLVADTEIAKLLTVAEGAEVNYVKSVDEEQLKVEDGKLSIVEIDQALVAGLKNAAGEDATLAAVLAEKAKASDVLSINAALEGKVDVPTNGDRFITTEEANKLEALVVGEGGKIEISGKVNASNVQELYNAVVNIVTGKGEGTYDGVAKELLGVEKGAQVNKIESILFNGVEASITNKQVNIPQATLVTLGLVKSSEDKNKVQVLADGTMEVNTITVDKIDNEQAIILNGGNAAGEYTAE